MVTIRVKVVGSLNFRSCRLTTKIKKADGDVETVHRFITFVNQPDGSFQGEKEMDIGDSILIVLTLNGINNTDYSFEYSKKKDGKWIIFDKEKGTISGGAYKREKDYIAADLDKEAK